VKLSLCCGDAVYRAGSRLTAHWKISNLPLEEIQGLEVSVLWHTEGKGDEDLQVHHFHRLSEAQVRRSGGFDSSSCLQCELPQSPLTYHGRLISIRWCVRLRLFLSGGRERIAEQPFYLVSSLMHSPCVAESPAGPDGLDELSPSQSSVIVNSDPRQLVTHASAL
jgi:hypothetical protein